MLFPALVWDPAHIFGLLLATKTRERLYLVNLWLQVEAAVLVNIMLKKKEKRSQEQEIELAPMDHDDIIYPSGLKLALLMMSIFVSMFLVSLVRLK